MIEQILFDLDLQTAAHAYDARAASCRAIAGVLHDHGVNPDLQRRYLDEAKELRQRRNDIYRFINSTKGQSKCNR